MLGELNDTNFFRIDIWVKLTGKVIKFLELGLILTFLNAVFTFME